MSEILVDMQCMHKDSLLLHGNKGGRSRLHPCQKISESYFSDTMYKGYSSEKWPLINEMFQKNTVMH